MDRRHYLKTIGAIAGVGLISVSPASPARRPRELTDGSQYPPRPLQFDRAVDMADTDCDPTGQADSSEALRRAAADDTVLEFPPGTYLLAETIILHGLRNFGIRGTENTTFKAPSGHNGDWLVIDRGEGLLFEDVSIDITARNAAPTLKFGVSDELVVRDIEVIGRGTRSDSRPGTEAGNVYVGNAFLPIVRSASGTGIVENFVAKHGGQIGTYNDGDGRAGIFIGRSNRGTIRLVNCHLSEFPNNGVYASRTNGTVQVIGGTFENNDISQVRLGSEGSLLSNATVTVDVDTVSQPSQPSDFLNPRGIWMEGADLGASGVVIRKTDINTLSSTAHPPGAIEIGRTAGRFHVVSVRIHCRAGPAIIAKSPTGGSYPPPPKPHWGTIENVDIRGSAAEGHAIHVVDRPRMRITDTDIRQTTGNRDGVRLVRSPGCTFEGGSITAGRYPILVAVSDETDDTDCLVTLGSSTRIESRRSVESAPEETVLADPTEWLIQGCVSPRMIANDRDSSLTVALTDKRLGQLYGVVLSR